MPNAPRPALGLLFAMLPLGAGAAAALAQNALGDGRLLEANPRVGSGGLNPAGRDFAAETRFRNAIVTGNVPGGMSFRGDVGYRAADDFRGSLGSEEIYPFLRDSVYSAPNTSVRGTDALRYQMRFSTGGLIDEQYGIPIVRRPGAGRDSGAVQNLPTAVAPHELSVLPSSTPATPAPGDPQFGAGLLDGAPVAPAFSGAPGIPGAGARPSDMIDESVFRPGAMRSTADYLTSRMLSLRVLGEGETEDGRSIYSVASPLVGIQLQRRFDYARPLNSSRIESLASTGPISEAARTGEPASGRVESSRVSSYEQVLNELRRSAEAMATPAQSPALAPEAGEGEDVSTIPGAVAPPQPGAVTPGASPSTRPEMPGAPGARPESTPMPATPGAPGARPEPTTPATPQREPAPGAASPEPSPATALLPGGRDQGLLAGVAPAVPQPAFQERLESLMKLLHIGSAEPGRAPVDRDAVAGEASSLLGGATVDVHTLMPAAPATRNLFTEHMAAAEALLRNDSWFDAEERFTAALTLRPGDPMAAAGRVNAQLGAALFLSASVNLQQLLRTYPELINVRFNRELLPEPDRVVTLRKKLRALMNDEAAGSRGAALLLAYLGHQFENQDDVRDGLAAIERLNETRGEAPDPLYDVVRAVWMNEDRPRK